MIITITTEENKSWNAYSPARERQFRNVLGRK